MPVLTKREKEILAYTLLGEAAGEGTKGMEAVAWVIRNRSESGAFPDNPAAVALQKKQFSTWNNPKAGPDKKFSKNSKEFKSALDAIDSVFAAPEDNDPTGGAIGYYASGGDNAISKPYWFDKVGDTEIKIGNHSFAANSEAKRLSRMRTDADSLSAVLPQEAQFGVGRFAVKPLASDYLEGQGLDATATNQITPELGAVLRAQPNPPPTPRNRPVTVDQPSGGLTTRRVRSVEIRPDGTPVLTGVGAQPTGGESRGRRTNAAPEGTSWLDRMRANTGVIRTTPAPGVQEFELPRDYRPAVMDQAIAAGDRATRLLPEVGTSPYTNETRVVNTSTWQINPAYEQWRAAQAAALPALADIHDRKEDAIARASGVAQPAAATPPPPKMIEVKTPRTVTVRVKTPTARPKPKAWERPKPKRKPIDNRAAAEARAKGKRSYVNESTNAVMPTTTISGAARNTYGD